MLSQLFSLARRGPDDTSVLLPVNRYTSGGIRVLKRLIITSLRLT